MMTRDIAELDGLAHEIKVCLDKSDNYHATARQKIAEVSPALEAGEFGDWRTQDWIAVRVGVTELGEIRRLMPPAIDIARAAIQAAPHKSDRAIAKDIGVGNKTVSRARATVSDDTVQQRVGLDGKERRMPAARMPEVYDPGPNFKPVPGRVIHAWVEQWEAWPQPVQKQTSAIIFQLWDNLRRRRPAPADISAQPW